MTSPELFNAMPTTLALEILDAVHAGEKKLYKAVVDAIAQARKVRPVFIERQQRAERHLFMLQSLTRPSQADVADSLLRTWLITKHSALLVDFLDALGINHEKGVVENLPKTVDTATLRNAVEAMLAKHPQAVVAVYLHAFNSMNGESWLNLETLLKDDPRLILANQA